MIMHKKSNYNVSCINTLEHLVKIVHIVFSDLCNYKIKKKNKKKKDQFHPLIQNGVIY